VTKPIHWRSMQMGRTFVHPVCSHEPAGSGLINQLRKPTDCTGTGEGTRTKCPGGFWLTNSIMLLGVNAMMGTLVSHAERSIAWGSANQCPMAGILDDPCHKHYSS
jgi:hypothetical protein